MGLEGTFGGGGGSTTEATFVQAAEVATSEVGTLTSYGDLTTVGPAVTIAVGPNGIAVVHLSAKCSNSSATANNLMSVALSVGNTVAASDNNAIFYTESNSNSSTTESGLIVLTGLTVASTTFTVKYRTSSGNATWALRCIMVTTY